MSLAIKAPIGRIYDIPVYTGPCEVEVIKVGFLDGYDVPFHGVCPCNQVMLCCG